MYGGMPKIGVHPTATDRSMPIVELAREAADRGLQSLYLPEHTHIPVGSESLPGGGHLDDRYRRTLDPFVASAFVAALTPLEVGTGVSLVAQHDPIALAKACATLDYLSGGRMVLGVGFGWNAAEAHDHQVPWAHRPAVVEETVRLMKAVWTEEEAAFEGKFRRMSSSWSWPKPVRPGGPPVLLGARASKRTIERIVSWADGWLAAGPDLTDPAFADGVALLRAEWRRAGRDGEPRICSFFRPGTSGEMSAQIRSGSHLRVHGMQVLLEELGRDEVLPILDGLAAAMASVTG
jgi:probable F420-dependent oxidoreductase